jgi:hypothetical protein
VPHLESLEERALPSSVSFSPPITPGTGFGAALATGDFNSDGNPDVALASGVQLGNGDGTFQPIQRYNIVGGGFAPVSVATGDFNSDGKLDVVTANSVTNSVTVLLGNGDGTFQPAHTISVLRTPNAVAVGDFNGDGKLDLATTVGVLLGNGDGTFQPVKLFDTLGGTFSLFNVTVGDFNGDGRADLVGSSGSNTVSVLLGNGDGTFQAPHSFTVGSIPEPVAVADFNGDGKLDLATANFGSNTVSVLLGNGDGTFQTSKNYAVGASPTSVAVGDFDGDNIPDLAVANELSNNVSVLVGNGDGTFQAAENFAAGADPFSVAVADFNGDGRPDLITGNLSPGKGGVLLNVLTTTTTVSGPTSSIYAQSVTYTATITSSGSPVTAGTVTFMDGSNAISPTLSVDGNGNATFSIASLNAGSHTITASYSGTPGGAGTTGFGSSSATTSLNVSPLTLSATAINFSAIAGAPFTGEIATFTNPDPFGNAASYTAIIDWDDGTTSIGTIIGTGTLTVSGPHTYAVAGNYAISMQISHNLGDTTTATVYPTATVTNLGQSVQDGLTGGAGFWNNKNGQRLIDSFNGGPDSTALSTWLANSFPNLFGDVLGFRNSDVAALYQSLFAQPGSNLQVEVLATALNVYASTLSLGGTAGQAYGFSVTATGLGADSFNVGSDGAAFGVANNTLLNVYSLLEALNEQAVNGVLYASSTTLQKEASDLFNALDKAGAIA